MSFGNKNSISQNTCEMAPGKAQHNLGIIWAEAEFL